MFSLRTSTLTAGLCSMFLGCSLVVSPAFADESKVGATKTAVINGKEYTFTKYLDDMGEVHSKVVDYMGNSVNEKDIPRAKRAVIDQELQAALKSGATGSGQIKVNIMLHIESTPVREMSLSGSGEIVQGRSTGETLNGRSLSDAQLHNRADKDHAMLHHRNSQRMKQQTQRITAWATRHGLENREEVKQAIRDGRGTITMTVTPQQIQALSKDSSVSGLELYQEPQDEIAEAMLATSIDPSALSNSLTRGNNIGLYMTEGGCPDEASWLGDYTQLSGSESSHNRNVAGIMRAVSPESSLYCRGNGTLPTFLDLHGFNLGFFNIPPLDPPILIGTGSYYVDASTAYKGSDRDWDDFVYNNNIQLFKSTGNQGSGTGNATSPGKGLNVISVGNYNDATDQIVSGSSWRDPETKNEKPEISAPGTNITAGGVTASGTSMASPHAAAFAADMMSQKTYLKYRPYLLKANMLSGATDDIAGGYEKVGLGGIDFSSAHWNGWWAYWTGNNNAFDSFAKNDGTDDGYIEKTFYISNSWDKVRAVISWLNRGSYTYDHRGDAHPIGMDLDFRVYDPNGDYVGSSVSWDNSFERVEFTPSVSGYYTFKINRYANRDTGLNLRLGMHVNLYNE